MSKWREVRLGEVAHKTQYGYTASTIIEDTGVKFLRITDIVDYFINWNTVPYCEINDKELEKYSLKKNDLVVARTGATAGSYKLIKEDSEQKIVFASYLIRFKIDYEKINPLFLNYYMGTSSYKGFIENHIGGAAQPNINANTLSRFKIQIPDLETQEKIAHILSTYDELIENNNRRIQILEKAAEEIYKEWFVRMRFPGHENTKFEKGIPEGWEVKRIGDLVNISSSKRIYASDYVDEGVAFYRSKEVIQLARGETISEPLYISIDKYNELKEKFGVPIQDDILLTSVGTIGIPMLVKDDSPFYFKDGNLTWIQSNSRVELALYLYLWIKSEIGSQKIRASTIGTSQSALTIEKLKNIKILIPKINIIDVFNNISNKIQEQINNLQLQNQNLIKQRDLLLPRLMNGNIEVK